MGYLSGLEAIHGPNVDAFGLSTPLPTRAVAITWRWPSRLGEAEGTVHGKKAALRASQAKGKERRDIGSTA